VLVERVSKRPISSLETGENGYVGHNYYKFTKYCKVSRVDSKSMQGPHKRTNLLQVSSEISPAHAVTLKESYTHQEND
jgi:hypothetical protein